MTVTLRSAVGPAGGKSAVGRSSSIPHKNLLTVLLAAPQGVMLSSNVAMVPNLVQFFWDTFVAVSQYEVHKILGSPRGGVFTHNVIAILTFESREN